MASRSLVISCCTRIVPAVTETETSATPGMRLMGIELRDSRGGRPDLLQAAVRVVIFLASNAILPILICAIALFDLRRRTLHDMLTSTVVVRR